MSYQYGSILFNVRDEAISAMIEDYITAGGMNRGSEVSEAIASPENTISEMIADGWDTNISVTPESPDYPTYDEMVAVLSDFNPSDLGVEDEFDTFEYLDY